MTTSASPREARESASTDRTILLMHIPKTAGTSLIAIVETEYARDEHCAIYADWNESRARIMGLPNDHPTQRLVIGHFLRGIEQKPEMARFLAPNLEHAVFLRDPVHRVLSHFNHVVDSPLPAHQRLIAQHPTLESFLDHIWGRNVQSYFMVGAELAPVLSERLALNRLQRGFDVVGLSERFDESVVLFAWRFGWRLPYYVLPRNVARPTPNRVRFEDLSDRLIQRIRTANWCDQAVYNLAVERFDAQCAQVPNFAERLQRYRNAPVLSPNAIPTATAA